MKNLWLSAALLACACSAHAAILGPDFRVSAGTQGFGLELDQPVIPLLLSVSAQGNYFKFGFNFNNDGTEYRGHARLLTGGLLLNLHPFFNGFRISGGVYDNLNRLKAVNKEPVTVAGVPVASDVKVEAAFKHYAPYAGFGWEWGHFITVSLDGGVMFQGKARTNFDVACTIPGCQVAANQQEQDVRDEANKYRYYPVVRLGIGF